MQIFWQLWQSYAGDLETAFVTCHWFSWECHSLSSINGITLLLCSVVWNHVILYHVLARLRFVCITVYLHFGHDMTWVRSRRCGCLVTWFCYHLIAKPGNKTAAPSWPDPYQWLSAYPYSLQCINNDTKDLWHLISVLFLFCCTSNTVL